MFSRGDSAVKERGQEGRSVPEAAASARGVALGSPVGRGDNGAGAQRE